MTKHEFNPDIVLIIKYDSETGVTKLETGNGKPLNSLTASILAINVAKANMEAFASQNLMQTHAFKALPGETKCRVPRCGQEQTHEIHNHQPQQEAEPSVHNGKEKDRN